MISIKRLCVFCGSLGGKHPDYLRAAAEFGRLLAREGICLVYGGGNVGMMGAIADAVLDNDGEAIGVIPSFLVGREISGRKLDHAGLTRLEIVDSMHQRKTRMAELADAFVALPGGFGTFEELCEIITWSQLGFHEKPCGVLNVRGYFDPLLAQFDTAVREGFLSADNRRLLLADTQAETLLLQLRSSQYSKTNKWILSQDLQKKLS